MPSIYYNNLGSQQSTILESDITKENLENVIGEVYCYGVDNYDNEPPKYIVVVSQDGEPIYNGKLLQLLLEWNTHLLFNGHSE